MNLLLNAEIINRFRRLVSSGRLAHAYLLAGPKGRGKVDTARLVAQMVNCTKQDMMPCGSCESCQKIEHGNHPDVYLIGNHDEETIKIDEVRQMIGRASLRAFEAAVKVFIFKDVQRMSAEAANALLKTLEEPAPKTLMLLTTSMPQSCLATIRSRCHLVHFFAHEDALPGDKEYYIDAFLTRSANDDLIKELTGEKQTAAIAMDAVFALVHDAMLLKAGAAQEKVLLRQRISDVQALSRRPIEDLMALEDQVVRARSLINERLNAKMALGLVRQRLWGN